MTYYRNGPVHGMWPDPITIGADAANMPEQTRRVAVRHNMAVRDYRNGSPLLGGERAILSLAHAIWMWAHEHGGDGFGDPHVLVPLIQAFNNALNFDLGRLDGGQLSTWVFDLAQHHGISEDEL